MTASLVVLCLAAFAMVAVAVSGGVHAALPWLDRLAVRSAPRHRVRLWLGMATLPLNAGVLAILAALLPSDKRYLVWKIRETKKGRIKMGPVRQRHADGEAPDMKVLPLRMEAEVVARLDEARDRLGL